MAQSAKLRKCQYGREANCGTPVAATEIWRGPAATLEDQTTITRYSEDVGSYGSFGRTEKTSLGAVIVFPSQPASYQQMPNVFEAGIMTATPAQVGATYTYTYNFATTSAPALKTYTLEVGDGEDVEEAEYCFVESFELTGAPNESVMLTANWRGRQATAVSFTGGLSKDAVDTLVFNTGKLYIDDSGGSIGSTQVSNSFLSFRLTADTGFRAVWTGEGNLYFSFAKLTEPVITLEITAEHTSDWDSAGEKAEWRAQNVRLVRIEFTGTAPNRVQIDLAGKWDTFSGIEEQDGDSILRGSFTAHHEQTDTLFGTIAVRTDVASL